MGRSWVWFPLLLTACVAAAFLAATVLAARGRYAQAVCAAAVIPWLFAIAGARKRRHDRQWRAFLDDMARGRVVPRRRGSA